MWRMILKKHYPKIKIAFSAEECGCEIYVKYDPKNIFCQFDNYYIEYDINDYESEYFDSIDDIINYVVNITELKILKEQLIGKTADEITNIVDNAAKQLNANNWFVIHEFQEVGLDEV
jgi:hypothetical protein